MWSARNFLCVFIMIYHKFLPRWLSIGDAKVNIHHDLNKIQAHVAHNSTPRNLNRTKELFDRYTMNKDVKQAQKTAATTTTPQRKGEVRKNNRIVDSESNKRLVYLW